MSKHTPGPWFVGPELNRVQKRFSANEVVTETICRVAYVWMTEREQQANARLIAAAPELLEACQAAWNCAVELPPSNATSELVRMLSDAIARATGEQP